MGKASRKKEQQTQGISSAPILASPPQSFLARPLPAVLTVLLLSLIVNFNVLSNGFGWDDEEIIQNLHPPAHGWQIGSIFLPHSTVKENAPYFRPVVELSYRLDYALWGKRPFGFHLSVLLAHLLNTALVFLLTQTLVRDKKSPYTFLPILVASLFAVHPVHAEAVAWIAGRNDVFCTTFILSSILLYIRFRQTDKEWVFGLSMLAFFFALLTKEMAVGLVLMFPLYDYLYGPTQSSHVGWRIRARVLIPILAVGFYLFLRANQIIHPFGLPLMEKVHSPFFLVITATGVYLKLLFFPYPHNPFIATLPGSPTFLLLAGFGSIFLISVMIWAILRRYRIIGWGLAWTLALLSPALVAAVQDLAATPVAERYLYAPSIGSLMVLGEILLQWINRFVERHKWTARKVFISTTVLWVVLTTIWGWESRNRNAVWRSPLTFWEAAVAVSSGKDPREAAAHNNLAHLYTEQQQLEKAIHEFQNVLNLKPDHTDAYNNQGIAFAMQGQLEKAVQRFQAAIRLDANHQKAHYNLGNAYALQGRLKEAILEYQTAIRLKSDDADAQYNLGLVYGRLEKFSEARRQYERALQIKPDYEAAQKALESLPK